MESPEKSGGVAPIDTATPIARDLLRVLLVWASFLIVTYVALHLTWRFRWVPNPIQDIFAVASEKALVTWTSVVTTCAIGVACLALGRLERSVGWYLTGALFVALSMDDEAMIHERIGWAAGVDRESFAYSWVYVVMPLIALFGLLAFAKIWHATKRLPGSRRKAIGAFALLAIALALEIPERALVESGETWRGFAVRKYSQLVEES